MPEFVTPPPLEPGSKVAVVAPASGLAAAYPHVYERGLDRLREVFDLEPVEFPTATRDHEYLSAHPEARARDIEDAFADPEIDGVIATIGGNDQIRILEYLDPEILEANPTRFYGTSDNTNLVSVLWNEGIISYYGGTLLTDIAIPGPLPDYQEQALRTAFFEESPGEIQPAPQFTDQDLEWANPENLTRNPEMEDNPGWDWRGGKEAVTGRTWGGCLEVVSLQVAAERFLPSMDTLEGAVLLLETSEELPSANTVQRLLLGMGERGLLERLGAVLVGRVKARSHIVDRDPAERENHRDSIEERIVDIVGEYNPTAPVVCNVDFGHTSPVVPVPVGSEVTVEPSEGRIEFS